MPESSTPNWLILGLSPAFVAFFHGRRAGSGDSPKIVHTFVLLHIHARILNNVRLKTEENRGRDFTVDAANQIATKKITYDQRFTKSTPGVPPKASIFLQNVNDTSPLKHLGFF